MASAPQSQDRRPRHFAEWDERGRGFFSATPFQRASWLAGKAIHDGGELDLLAAADGTWHAGLVVVRAADRTEVLCPRGPSGVDCAAILRGAEAMIARYPAATLRISPYVALDDGGAELEAGLRAIGFASSSRAPWEGTTVVIRVDDDDDTLMGRMSTNRRREIRSLATSVEVVERNDVAGVRDFVSCYTAFAPTVRVRTMPLDYMLALLDGGLGDDLGTLIFTRAHGEWCSAALLLRHEKLAWLSRAPHWPGRPPLGSMLQWAAIRWARAQGCHRYDLGGVILEGERAAETAGLTRFKLSLGGAVLRTIAHLERPPVQPLLRTGRVP